MRSNHSIMLNLETLQRRADAQRSRAESPDAHKPVAPVDSGT
jgi:hypothetical protein